MEVDIVKSDLSLHLVIFGVWIVDFDLGDAINDVESLFARSLSKSQPLDVGRKTTKSNHSEEDSEKDGDDVSC